MNTQKQSFAYHNINFGIIICDWHLTQLISILFAHENVVEPFENLLLYGIPWKFPGFDMCVGSGHFTEKTFIEC